MTVDNALTAADNEWLDEDNACEATHIFVTEVKAWMAADKVWVAADKVVAVMDNVFGGRGLGVHGHG